MNVLIVNDDGIKAPGIRRLVEAFSADHDVYVFAPDRQQSGKSQSITLTKNIFVNEAIFPGTKAAFMLTGMPADCAKYGIQWMQENDISCDILISGINHGSNLGVDTLYSGTVGAAREGALTGVRSIAVSMIPHKPEHFSVACGLTLKAAEYAVDHLSANTILNINVPDLPRDEIKGVLFTKLGGISFDDCFTQMEDGGYRRDGALIDHSGTSIEYDVGAVAAGYASVTPLIYDMTEHDMIARLEKEWNVF